MSTTPPPCEEARQALHAFLDGELQMAEASELQRHVRECRGCARELAVLGSLRKALREAMPATRAPAELRARISAIVDGRAPAEPLPAGRARVPLRRRVGGALLAAAAGVVTVAGGLALANRLLPPEEEPRAVAPRPAPLAIAVAGLHDDVGDVPLEAVGADDDQLTALLETRGRLPGHPMAPEEANLLGARLVSFSPGDVSPMGAGTDTAMRSPRDGRPVDRGDSAEGDEIGASRPGTLPDGFGAAPSGTGVVASGELAAVVHYSMRDHPVTVLVFDVRSRPFSVAGLQGPFRVAGGRDAYFARVGDTHVVFFVDGPLGYAVASTASLEFLLSFVGGTVSVP